MGQCGSKTILANMDQGTIKKLFQARNQALNYYCFHTHSFSISNKWPEQAARLKTYKSIVKDSLKYFSSLSPPPAVAGAVSVVASSQTSGLDTSSSSSCSSPQSLSDAEIDVVATLMDDALQLADWRLDYNLLDSTRKKKRRNIRRQEKTTKEVEEGGDGEVVEEEYDDYCWEGMSPTERRRLDDQTGNVVPLELRTAKRKDDDASSGGELSQPPPHFSWLAFGDHGGPWNDELYQFAKRANQVAGDVNADMVLCLGDNFYQNGVNSVDDPQWQQFTKCFLEPNPYLHSIPWRATLGNHDHGLYQRGCPEAQIEYSEKCPGGAIVQKGINYRKCWQMPSNKYSFRVPIKPLLAPLSQEQQQQLQQQAGDEDVRSPVDIDIAFICFDTNSCQFHVRNSHPERWEEWEKDLAWLDAELTKHADATWKVFYSHHPLYTRGHVNEARCLRTDLGKTYAPFPAKEDGREFPGMGLQSVLRKHGVDVCFAGHDHVMSMYKDCYDYEKSVDDDKVRNEHDGNEATNNGNSRRCGKMLNVVSGAVTEFGYHKVVCQEEPMNYQGSQVGTGFAVGEAVAFYSEDSAPPSVADSGSSGTTTSSSSNNSAAALPATITTQLRVRFVSSDPIGRQRGPLYQEVLEKKVVLN